MRLGISSHTFAWSAGVPGYDRPHPPLTAEGLLEKAAGLEVGVVQIAENLPLDPLPRDDRRRFAEQAAAAGISVEIGMAGIDRDRLLAGLALAAELKSPILRVLPDGRSGVPTAEEVVSAVRDVATEFARAQIVLAIENHGCFKAAVLREIVERIDSRSVGICFDTANSIGCLESAEQVLDTLGALIVNVHLKDFCVFRPRHQKGFVVEGRAAGQGQLDIPKLLPRIDAVAPDARLIVELWVPPQPTLAESIELENRWAAESIRYVRRWVPC